MKGSQGFDFSIKESQVTDKCYELVSFASLIESVRAGDEQILKLEHCTESDSWPLLRSDLKH